MKNKISTSEHVKMFCSAILLFYIITAILYVLTISGIYINAFSVGHLTDFLLIVTQFLITIATFFSAPWFLITFIWCLVICKQEHSPRIFAKPIVIISLLISLFLPIILISTGF